MSDFFSRASATLQERTASALNQAVDAARVIAGSAVGQAVNGVLQAAQQSPAALSSLGPVPEARENLADTAGRRVRLRAKPAAKSTVYGNGIMSPLISTNGMIFPYQPLITYQQDVTYTNMELVHANQDFQSYTRTPALKLAVDGEFTVQNQPEGLYALACIHFLRTSTKMWFGGTNPGSEAEQMQGTPPPVLLFDAYGQFMFNALPVIITGFSVTLPKDVDYVPVSITKYSSSESELTNPNANYQNLTRINEKNIGEDIRNGYAWLPAVFNIQVQLTVQNTPRRLRNFDLSQFRSGQLLRGGGWV